MTKFDSSEITCPKCGNRQETTLWDSINVRLNPELREKLLHREINIFKCESCDTVAFIAHPLLYNDMKRNYCVQYFPPQLLEDESFLRQYSCDGSLKMEQSAISISEVSRYLLTPHIVFDQNEMVHYISFRERLFEIYEES